MIRTYLQQILKMRYAFAGVWSGLTRESEKSFRLILLGSIIAIGISTALGTSIPRLLIISAGYLYVLAQEQQNTGTEVVGKKFVKLGYADEKRDSALKHAFDSTSSGVFLAGIAANLIWVALTFFAVI